MKCPGCGSELYLILKSKEGKRSKELLLKCAECETVYKRSVTKKTPIDCRIIISEYGNSTKTYLKLYPDEMLEVGNVLDLKGLEVEVTSLETKRGARVNRGLVSSMETIWASSLSMPARIGVSVDFGGRTFSKKVKVERDFEFKVGDVIKLGKTLFKVHAIKTNTQRLRRGAARASTIRRVYGRSVDQNEFCNHDLSTRVVG
jgi:uncharacterized Zn finger protein